MKQYIPSMWKVNVHLTKTKWLRNDQTTNYRRKKWQWKGWVQFIMETTYCIKETVFWCLLKQGTQPSFNMEITYKLVREMIFL